ARVPGPEADPPAHARRHHGQAARSVHQPGAPRRDDRRIAAVAMEPGGPLGCEVARADAPTATTIAGLDPAALPQVAEIEIDGYDPSARSLVDCCELPGAVRERGPYSFIHNAGDRPVGSRGLAPQGLVDVGVEIDRGALVVCHGRRCCLDVIGPLTP